MIIKTKSISQKLISIIIVAMIVMAIAIAAVIGVSGYANLESIAREHIERSAHVISERVIDLAEKSHRIIDSINQLEEVQNSLATETTLGPYYHEQASESKPIDAPEQIYKLQAQLELADLLRPIMLARESHSLALYHLDSFNEDSSISANLSRPPTFSMRLADDLLELAQYSTKNNTSMIASVIDISGHAPYGDLFDVSSIYEHDLAYFLTRLKAQPLLVVPDAPALEEKRIIDRLAVIDGKPFIQTTARLNISTTHPENWTNTTSNAYALVAEEEISRTQILAFKELVNAEIVLLVNGEVLVSTLKTTSFSYDPVLKIASIPEEYFTATRKITFPSDMKDSLEVEILVMSPVSIVARLNFQLFMQILMVILCSTFVVCILFYVAVAIIISTPLSGLLKGVEHLSQGELTHSIIIKSEDEIGRLALAFNKMSADVHEKRDQLRENHNELERLLEAQGEELELTQTQLIEAEKMSSLGELVAGVSHEVSTPIGICITAESFFQRETEIIQNKYNDGSMSRQDFISYMKIALENSEILSANLSRSAELIKNFKQIAVDQCIEDLRPIVVYRYVEDLISTLKPRMKELKHKVILSGDESLIITSLPGAIAQIITNLIMNSIIHGFDGIDEGNISIDITQHELGAVIVYKDDGRGMSEQAQEKIFNPFFTTRKGSGGTGLGMNIVYKLITDALHGSIKCTSQLNQGVRFDIVISNQEF
jgi:signal transduction histidine kinase